MNNETSSDPSIHVSLICYWVAVATGWLKSTRCPFSPGADVHLFPRRSWMLQGVLHTVCTALSRSTLSRCTNRLIQRVSPDPDCLWSFTTRFWIQKQRWRDPFLGALFIPSWCVGSLGMEKNIYILYSKLKRKERHKPVRTAFETSPTAQSCTSQPRSCLSPWGERSTSFKSFLFYHKKALWNSWFIWNNGNKGFIILIFVTCPSQFFQIWLTSQNLICCHIIQSEPNMKLHWIALKIQLNCLCRTGMYASHTMHISPLHPRNASSRSSPRYLLSQWPQLAEKNGSGRHSAEGQIPKNTQLASAWCSK